MTLTGYAVHEITEPTPGRGDGPPIATPAEDASGGKIVECRSASCTAATKFSGQPGWYTLHVGGRVEGRPAAAVCEARFHYVDAPDDTGDRAASRR